LTITRVNDVRANANSVEIRVPSVYAGYSTAGHVSPDGIYTNDITATGKQRKLGVIVLWKSRGFP
jgi:hypothetical protein